MEKICSYPLSPLDARSESDEEVGTMEIEEEREQTSPRKEKSTFSMEEEVSPPNHSSQGS